MGKYSILIVLCVLAFSCKSIHEIEMLPSGNFFISPPIRQKLFGERTAAYKEVVAKQDDSLILFTTVPPKGATSVTLDSLAAQRVRLQQKSFDIDIFTIPFKIRPSVNGFPEQLNPNFSAALYLGRRHDHFRIEKDDMGVSKIYGSGFGYGFFTGLGAVTMNPFVTESAIDYEYDGMVLMGGVAGIYDAKKFNIGIAVGVDYLVDKNKKAWLYQNKPWMGVLFGIDIN